MFNFTAFRKIEPISSTTKHSIYIHRLPVPLKYLDELTENVTKPPTTTNRPAAEIKKVENFTMSDANEQIGDLEGVQNEQQDEKSGSCTLCKKAFPVLPIHRQISQAHRCENVSKNYLIIGCYVNYILGHRQYACILFLFLVAS